jgi:outer membrane protein OmpA-like peptidoglycan-associated protein
METLMRAVIFLVAAVGSPNCAQAAQVYIEFAGQNYQGPPQFEVLADGSLMESGAVERLDGHTIDLTVPEGAQVLAVRFTNDLADAQGPSNDRNLIIRSVTVDGTSLPGTSFDGKNTSKIGRDLLLYTNTEVTLNLQEHMNSEEAELTEGEVTPLPIESAQTETDIPVTTGKVETKTEEPVAAERPENCSTTVEVTGFSSGVVNLSADQQALLAPVLDAKNCSVTVTGYSSTSGPAGINEQVALDRAQVILDYLVQQGVMFQAQEAVSGGETTEFGPEQADNRRVVVQFQ